MLTSGEKDPSEHLRFEDHDPSAELLHKPLRGIFRWISDCFDLAGIAMEQHAIALQDLLSCLLEVRHYRTSREPPPACAIGSAPGG